MLRICLIIVLGWWTPLTSVAVASESNSEAPPPTIAEKTRALKSERVSLTITGIHAAARSGWKLTAGRRSFSMLTPCQPGVGSNDVGLDRGQLGRTRIVRFERIGPRVMLFQSNTDFRAESDDAMERRTVREAFAESVLWGFEVVAEEDDRVLVDAADFFLSDAHRVIQTLAEVDQGSYELDASRSAFYLPRTRNFPRNTEVEVTLSFTSDSPSPLVTSVTPSPESLTVRQHHSLVQLPDAGYSPATVGPEGGIYEYNLPGFRRGAE